MTRRGLIGPLMAGLTLAACAPVMEGGISLGPKGWRQAATTYGSDPHQTLDLYRPAQAQNLPILLFLPDNSPEAIDRQWAENLARQGYVVAVVGRRPSPVSAFPAYISDAARAVAWSLRNAADIGGSADRLAVVGRGQGAHAALMLVRDERYLAAVTAPGRIKAVARIDLTDGVDATFTDPSAYRAGQDVPIWTGSSGDQASLEAYLKAHL